jgi:superfamily I DNA/RNA helicase
MIRPDQWQPVGRLVLEPNAITAATTTEENVVVTAGPGAGKTELLAQRADFLLRTGQCPYPRRILAVSFKVDAARNLRDRVRRRSGEQLAARLDSFTFHAFAKRLIDSFRPALVGYDALEANYRIDTDSPGTRIEGQQITFADLVPLALAIVESNSYAQGGLRQTYSHVFLDEFQDCTRLQYQLVKAAFKETAAILTAVGDTKQRIMTWAGALDGVMENFAKDFSARSLPLYQNFRSAPKLRRMQSRMIAQMDPDAVSEPEDLTGDDGVIEVLDFETEYDEARAVSSIIEGWLVEEEVAPVEIAVLVRQQPHLVAAVLAGELADKGIAYRNEQESQDLTAEPAAGLVLNFIRVIAADKQPDAYRELMRVVTRASASEEDALRFDSQLKRLLQTARAVVRAASFNPADSERWRLLVADFLHLLPRPTLIALSPGYKQGSRLDDLIEQSLAAFEHQLAIDGNAIQALRRLSEIDAVRFLTIHKCKGLEFEKVVGLGVEWELFWGEPSAAMSEFFVAVSRAKQHLVLTHVNHRDKPAGVQTRWDEWRNPQQEFLDFAAEE